MPATADTPDTSRSLEDPRLAVRTGVTAAVVFIALGVPYVAGVGVTFAQGGFPPAEPVSTLLHVLVMAMALALVPFWAAVHATTPPGRRVFSLASLSCVTMMSVCVVLNRFIALTAVHYAAEHGGPAGLEWFLPYEWPSLTMALEVAGWGLFFGIACLLLIPAFGSSRLDRAVTLTLALSAGFCLFGVVALMMNDFTLMSAVAPIGWGPGAVTACVLIALRMRRRHPRTATPRRLPS
ncbi:hypothetical protein LX16_4892 [Stackebrandtia albiflava]|uniref:DUF4386 family protein n=1 Tax=Stackebrandtia albiflava TaxID=406432 RepID=A0A562UQ39_9ACTN|nr:hypothetical protein [Stackebrandtia albiflava]TWJ07731.1 hypothetical protein LX16_4892 [Stackebrandtia albiflava]